ncbi:MAG: glycoside hydrolase family 2 protein [Planctomycetota bacterium]|jgi:beta-galactosidase/beta-glucuronidase
MVRQESYNVVRGRAGALKTAWCCAVIALVLTLCPAVQAQWEPAKGPLMTKWASQVSPDKVHPEYPRPQMVREDWQNLNGLWDYAIRPKDEPKPDKFDGKILVPFAAESALSGVMKRVNDPNRLWYRREFEIPDKWKQNRVLLNFGAVDWDTTVWINGKEVGKHRGGYDPFSFDITDALEPTGRQEIVLSVWDPINAGTQPRGKQVRNPHKIWYTPTTGIWQTVWLEPVSGVSIKSLTIIPHLDESQVEIQLLAHGEGRIHEVQYEVRDDSRVLNQMSVKPGSGSSTWQTPFRDRVKLYVDAAKPWTPDTPFLYDLKVTLLEDGKIVDQVSSYFGMRKIAVAKDKDGVNRLFLNNKPVFQYGPLDQGFWPDGIYTAPTDEALRYDIEQLKKIGCNMMRKHVKIEPLRFYYWCDKLGLLTQQGPMNRPNSSRRS